MMSGTGAPEESEPVELVFAPEPRSRGASLITMLGLSLLGHAISFYVLQVYYAPAVALPPSPPPVRWTLLPPGSPEGAALARWLEVSDPALVAGARAPSPDRVLAGLPAATAYVPSYATRAAATGSDLPSLLPLATVKNETPEAGGASVPSMFPPGPVPTTVPTARHAPAAMMPAPRTRVEFSENLRGRLPADSPDAAAAVRLAHHAATLAEVLRPAEFLVGVRSEGGPPVVFREESSGTAAADDAARAYLEALPFTPLPAARGGDPVWGRATFRWGMDVYR